MTYHRGKPQPQFAGECGGGKIPQQISHRKDQAKSPGTEEKPTLIKKM